MLAYTWIKLYACITNINIVTKLKPNKINFIPAMTKCMDFHSVWETMSFRLAKAFNAS